MSDVVAASLIRQKIEEWGLSVDMSNSCLFENDFEDRWFDLKIVLGRRLRGKLRRKTDWGEILSWNKSSLQRIKVEEVLENNLEVCRSIGYFMSWHANVSENPVASMPVCRSIQPGMLQHATFCQNWVWTMPQHTNAHAAAYTVENLRFLVCFVFYF